MNYFNYIKDMEKKVIKLEDLKEGMKLRSVKNVCYVDEVGLDDGVLLEEELFDKVSWVIKITKMKRNMWDWFYGTFYGR